MKIFFLLIFTLILNCSIFAQHNDIGIFLGGSYYLGDLNPSKQFFLSKPALGIAYRHSFNPRISLRINLLDGEIRGADSKTKINEIRNLSFRTNIAELSTQLEINFLPFLTGKKEHPFTPYVFGGISLFKFNPQAEYNGTWYDLQPLKTEGETKPYNLISLGIPFGMGFKMNISKRIAVDFEWGLRKTFTDYLDDISKIYVDPSKLNSSNSINLADRSPEVGAPRNVINSQRGNSQNDDWYSFFGIMLIYKIKDPKAPCDAFNTEKKHKIYIRIFNWKKLNLFNKF